MKHTAPGLVLRTAPFLKHPTDTPNLMRQVLLALLPVVVAAAAFFGMAAMLVVGASTLGALATEYAFGPSRNRGSTLHDGSALLSGILLGLTLPPSFPLWMAFLGGIVAIGLGKLVWGGLGQNLFNPALVGRAFLQAAFPTTITTWAPQGQGFLHLSSANLAAPLMQARVDTITAATPLGLMKFQHELTPLWSLLVGNSPGSIGETSSALLIVLGLWLAWRRTFDWRIPVAILVTVAVFAGILWIVNPETYPSPLFMLFSGGLLFGTLFMATDPVTSPMAPLGVWLFGVGIGVLVVLIRLWGGLPEGVMYAILLMNAATPLIDRVIQPRPFGRGKHNVLEGDAR